MALRGEARQREARKHMIFNTESFYRLERSGRRNAIEMGPIHDPAIKCPKCHGWRGIMTSAYLGADYYCEHCEIWFSKIDIGGNTVVRVTHGDALERMG